MKSFKRFLSAIMAFCMLLGTLAMLTGITAFAEETAGGETEGGETVTPPVTQPVKAPDKVSDLLTLDLYRRKKSLLRWISSSKDTVISFTLSPFPAR